MLPPAKQLYQYRIDRLKRGDHHVDKGVTLERVERQLEIYRQVALHFRRNEMLIYVIDEYDGIPKEIIIESVKDRDIVEIDKTRERL
jgi:DUF438 domain-containing protein